MLERRWRMYSTTCQWQILNVLAVGIDSISGALIIPMEVVGTVFGRDEAGGCGWGTKVSRYQGEHEEKFSGTPVSTQIISPRCW